MKIEELDARLKKLEEHNKELEEKVKQSNEALAVIERSAAIGEIISLQSRYNMWLENGYYLRVWEELFTHSHPEVECEMMDGGVYVGPEKVKRLWESADKAMNNDKRPGMMHTVMSTTPCVVVSKDCKTAAGNWHLFGPHAMYVTPYPGDHQKLTAFWLFGKYNNKYVKENGQWKFLSMQAIRYFRSPYQEGWVRQAECRRIPIPKDFPPDRPSTYPNALYHPDDIRHVWEPAPPEMEE